MTMPLHCELDHLVVGARTLAEGVAWCESALGVMPGPGGRHDFMGTHNRLLPLSSPRFPRCYLEIIAIDPDAAPPAQPRWFDLDRADFTSGPRLLHLVARNADLASARAALCALDLDPGPPTAASRETAGGRLRWDITVTGDGRLRLGGALPTLIHWQGAHPTEGMPAAGLALQRLELRGWPAPLQAVLALAGVELAPARAGEPGGLSACLQTPGGTVWLHASVPGAAA